jgi:hypothetical protein
MADFSWFEGIKTAVAAGATIVVARWGIKIQASQRDIARQQASIAAEQKRIAAAKLNLELFEERYAVFERVWTFLSAHVVGDDKDLPLWPADFNNLIPKAQFLFGENIAEYMREISSKHTKLATTYQALRQRADVASAEQAELITDLQGWFYTEASQCFKRFADYLDFSAWKADLFDRGDATLRSSS